jgi:hypothetical protein
VDAYAFVGGLPSTDVKTVALLGCLNKDWASVVGPVMEARLVGFIAEHFKEIVLPDGTYLSKTLDNVNIKDTLLDLGQLARLIKTFKALKHPADSKGQPLPDLAWIFKTSFFRDAQRNNKNMVTNTSAFMLDILQFTSLIGRSKLTRRTWEYIYMSFSIISNTTFPEHMNRYTAIWKLEQCQTLRLFLNFDKKVLPGILKLHFLELLRNLEQTWRSVLA